MIKKITNDSFFNFLNDTNKVKNSDKTGFADLIKSYISDVNKKQIDADKAIEDFVKGKNMDITSTVLSVEKAEVSLQLFLQIRNKLLQSYKEIMRIQA